MRGEKKGKNGVWNIGDMGMTGVAEVLGKEKRKGVCGWKKGTKRKEKDGWSVCDKTSKEGWEEDKNGMI